MRHIYSEGHFQVKNFDGSISIKEKLKIKLDMDPVYYGKNIHAIDAYIDILFAIHELLEAHLEMARGTGLTARGVARAMGRVDGIELVRDLLDWTLNDMPEDRTSDV